MSKLSSLVAYELAAEDLEGVSGGTWGAPVFPVVPAVQVSQGGNTVSFAGGFSNSGSISGLNIGVNSVSFSG